MSNGRRGARMTKQWFSIPGTAIDLGADATALLGFTSQGIPSTVLRMLGEYVIIPTSAPVAGDEATVTLGIGVVSNDAATLGSAAMPDPADEAEYPWLYWASHALIYNGTLEESALAGSSLRHSFDVKSMRKMKPQESLAFIAQIDSVGSGGQPPLTIGVGVTRILIAT